MCACRQQATALCAGSGRDDLIDPQWFAGRSLTGESYGTDLRSLVLRVKAICVPVVRHGARELLLCGLSHAGSAQGSGHDESHVMLTLSHDNVSNSICVRLASLKPTYGLQVLETSRIRFSQVTRGLLMHACPFQPANPTTLGSSCGAVSAQRVLFAITKHVKCPLHI